MTPAEAEAAGPEVADRVPASRSAWSVAADYDPEGDDEEHSEEIELALDDDRSASAWTTETYESDSFGEKQGVGMYVDAGEPVEASRNGGPHPHPRLDARGLRNQ